MALGSAAAVYDEQSRKEDLTAETKRRLAARERRRKIVDTYLDQVTAASTRRRMRQLNQNAQENNWVCPG